MISKTLTYVDYNDKKCTTTFHFHLTVPEITKMQFRDPNQTLFDAIVKMTEEDDTRSVLELLETIVRSAVGVRSEDGARFSKNDDIVSELFDTEAYSVLFEELLKSPDVTAKFLQGMLPTSVLKEANSKAKLDELSNLSKEELLERFNDIK